MTLFDEAGGEAGVAAIVEALCSSVTSDPEFSSWFAELDLERLKGHQRSFITVALGGPEVYAGMSIRSAHSGMGITPSAFTSFVAHLGHAMAGLGADEALVEVVTKRMSLMRAAVVEAH